MSSFKRTPGQWSKATPRINGGKGTAMQGAIIAEDGRTIAHIAIIDREGTAKEERMSDYYEAHENMLFIVKATNSHDMLVEAVKLLLRNPNGYSQITKDWALSALKQAGETL